MISNRLAYFFTVIVLLVFVILREGIMTYLALYSVLLLPILSVFIAILSKNRFELNMSLSHNSIYKGETADYVLEVKNTSFFPFTSVRIKFNEKILGIDSDFAERSFSILPFQSEKVTFTIQPLYRGNYKIGVRQLIIYDFLGLFKFKTKIKEEIQLVVQPRTRDVNNILLQTSPYGLISEKTLSQDEDYTIISDLRQYQPTDGYKKIHWKASARRNELISKNFQKTRKESAIFILDNSISGTKKLTDIEKLALEDIIMEVYVSVLSHISLKQFVIGLHHIGYTSSSHTNSFEYLYQVATGIEFNSDTTFDTFFDTFVKMQVETDNLIIFVKEINPTFISTLHELLVFGNNVSVIHFDKNAADSPELKAKANLQFFYYTQLLRDTHPS